MSKTATAIGNMPRTLVLGSLNIDNQRLEITLGPEKVDVTLTEIRIIRMLIESYPQLVQRKDLTFVVWGGEEVLSKTINTHLSNLRIKLAQWNFKISSIKNQGIILKSE